MSKVIALKNIVETISMKNFQEYYILKSCKSILLSQKEISSSMLLEQMMIVFWEVCSLIKFLYQATPFLSRFERGSSKSRTGTSLNTASASLIRCFIPEEKCFMGLFLLSSSSMIEMSSFSFIECRKGLKEE